MRVMMLGGTKFIGAAIVEELAAYGHELLIVHRGDHEPPDLPTVDHLHTDRGNLPHLRAGRQAIPTGAGSFLWTRGYVHDIASGVRLALESEATIGEVVNPGESRTWSMGLWAGHVMEAAGGRARFVQVPDPLLPDDLRLLGNPSQHLLVDCSKARDLLDWTETDPHEALARSVAWHLEHPPETRGEDFASDDRALAAVGG